MVVPSITLVGIDISWEISLAVSESYIRFVVGFLLIQWFIEIFVYEMVLRTLFATDVTAGWHANQMNLKRIDQSSINLKPTANNDFPSNYKSRNSLHFLQNV